MRKKAQKVLSDFVDKNREDMGKIEEVEARLEFPLKKRLLLVEWMLY